jgi:hypothetical protein
VRGGRFAVITLYSGADYEVHNYVYCIHRRQMATLAGLLVYSPVERLFIAGRGEQAPVYKFQGTEVVTLRLVPNTQ